MACGCNKNNRTVTTTTNPQTTYNIGEVMVKQKKDVPPTEQCRECIMKHYTEAYCLATEYTYLDANRKLVIGNLRAIVLHSFKEWKNIADLARKCALLYQHVQDSKALEKMELLGRIVEEMYYSDPILKQRLEDLKKGEIEHG